MYLDDTEITDLAGLLAALAVDDPWVLDALVRAEVAAPTRTAHRPGGLDITAAGARLSLDYPFGRLAFWVALRDLDERCAGALEDCGH